MKPELLVPAGDMDCLKAAINHGADAVYLGLQQFSARKKAYNFTLKELKLAVRLAHESGVKIYVALNTLIKNSEMESYFSTAKEAYLAGVDAIIIQDLSLANHLKENFPDLQIHASTQASVNNTFHLKQYTGLDRVILPRELSKDQIRKFINNTDIPVEVFVHGAMCFSVSGRCLMSSMIGGRSGNRGLCAQPCRKKYNGKYLLSMKDLCLLEHIKELQDLGVSSLKIEGRLRSKDYVAIITRTYRKALDGEKITDKDIELMYLAFNREFTSGYFNDDDNRITEEVPKNRGIYLGTVKDNMIKLNHDLRAGDGIGIWKKDGVSGLKIMHINKDGQSVQFAKRGDVVKIPDKLIEETDKIYKTSLPDYQLDRYINKKQKILGLNREINEVFIPRTFNIRATDFGFFVKVYDLEGIRHANQFKDVKVIFYPLDSPDFNKAKTLTDKRIYAVLPSLIYDEDVPAIKTKLQELKPDGILAPDKSVEYKNIIYDYVANAYNDCNIDDLNKPIVSPELNFTELSRFCNKNFLVLVHGNLTVMTTFNCLPDEIKDDKGYTFPIIKEKDYYKIKNSKQIGLLDNIVKLKEVGITQYYLDLSSDVKKWLDIYTKILNKKKINTQKIAKGFTTGMFNRKVY